MKIIRNDEAVSPAKTVITEDAVSPVIGVILMVAITVILAAVIAAFVFGMAGTTQTTKTVGITASIGPDTNNFTMVFQGGADADKVTNLSFSLDGGAPVAYYNGKPWVGMVNYTNGGGSGHRLIITGKFQDGSSQVLYDRQF